MPKAVSLQRCRAAAFLLWGIAVPATPAGQSLEAWQTDGEKHAQSHAIVSFGYAAAPINKVLLIRAQSGQCALRFTNFSRGHDAKPGSVLNTGDETLGAEYEWAFVSGDGATRSGRGTVSRGPVVGVGRVVVPSTSARIECGSINGLSWNYPMYVSMFTGSQPRDTGLRFAPTGCVELGTATATGVQLSWYGYSEGRAVLYIQQSQLPCQ
jgi:hypothetical protein